MAISFYPAPVRWLTVTSLALTDSTATEYYRESNANATLSLTDDFKDGLRRELVVYNSHATDAISIAFPTPRSGDVSPAYIPAGFSVAIGFRWSVTNSLWRIFYSGIMTRVLS